MDRTKPAVLLLHGQPGSPSDWDRVIEELGDRALVLAPARPGWAPGSRATSLAGNAQAAVAELDRAGIEQAVVVGHSLGGAVAAWLAASCPDRTAALVLLAPAANQASLNALDRILAAPLAGSALSAAALAGGGGWLSLRTVRRRLSENLGLPEGYLRSSGRLLLKPESWRSFLAEQRALIRELPELESRLGDVIAPTTILAGTGDRIVSLGSAQRLAGQIPGARLVELAGAHHLLHQQRPAEVAEIILAAAG